MSALPFPEVPTNWEGVSGAVDPTAHDQRYAHDAKLYVQFYLRPMLLGSESEKAGRPIYRDVEHVRIMIPGDKLNVIDRIASLDDKQRFADHYAKFQAGKGQEVVGTRLEAVPWMTRSKVEEYRFFGIITVEQLAACSDEVGHKFPSFQTDKRKAQQFLEASTGTESRITELEAMIADLRAKLDGTAKDKPAEVQAAQINTVTTKK